MNNSNINRCPVCGNEVVNGICQTCGYVRLVFPEVVPSAISNMEIERSSIAKKGSENLKSKDEEIRSLRSTIENQEKALKESEEANRDLSRKLKAATDELETLKNRPIAPDAYFILNDGRKRTVLPIMKGNVCFFASGTATGLPQLAGKDVSVLPVMTPVKIAFLVEYGNSGFFRITDIAGSLLIIGHLGKTSAKLTNGCTIKIKGTDISLDFSQQ